jgi:hypothetical protein
LELVSPDLIAERDYSIMFYGGKLLSHLSLERDIPEQIDKVPEELIPILRISQHAVVVMDSDRKSPRGRLRQTKERVKAECERSVGLCWVTEGREIENLLPKATIERACGKLLDKDIQFDCGKYDSFPKSLSKAILTVSNKVIRYQDDKVKYARIFAREMKLEDIEPNLLQILKDLADQIVVWNE